MALATTLGCCLTRAAAAASAGPRTTGRGDEGQGRGSSTRVGASAAGALRGRRALVVALGGLGLVQAARPALAEQGVSPPPPPGCACPPSVPCPTEGPNPDWFWAPGQATPALTFWSPVTGTCLPWGPLGPVGLPLAATAFFQSGRAFRDPGTSPLVPAENLAALGVIALAACAPRSANGVLGALVTAGLGIGVAAAVPVGGGLGEE